MKVDYVDMAFKMRQLYAIMDNDYSYKYIKNGTLQMIVDKSSVFTWIQYAEQKEFDFGWQAVMQICNVIYREHMDKLYEGQYY